MACDTCGKEFRADSNDFVYRCFDCHDPAYECQGCALTFHRRNPFHRMEEWDPRRGFWERRSLGELGYVINLGHPHGHGCPLNRKPRPMTIVHGHGVHPYAVRFCYCTDKATGSCTPEPVQLIKYGLWPGSWDTPHSAFTISMMRDHHLLSLQAQISSHDFYAYLRRLTDNVCPENVTVSATSQSYESFLTMAFRTDTGSS